MREHLGVFLLAALPFVVFLGALWVKEARFKGPDPAIVQKLPFAYTTAGKENESALASLQEFRPIPFRISAMHRENYHSSLVVTTCACLIAMPFYMLCLIYRHRPRLKRLPPGVESVARVSRSILGYSFQPKILPVTLSIMFAWLILAFWYGNWAAELGGCWSQPLWFWPAA